MANPAPQGEVSPRGNPQNQHPKTETNLDEAAAPPPIYDRAEKPTQQHEYLDSERSNNFSSNEHDPQPNQQMANTEPAQSSKPKRRGLGNALERYVSEILRNMYIVSYLIIFSLLGTLLRLTIECLTFYPGTPVNTSVLWANVGGSFVMGFLSEDKELFRVKDYETENPDSEQKNAAANKKTVPLYIGLTTGFCGSLTSFSTFIRDVLLAIINNIPMPIGAYSKISLYSTPPGYVRAPNGGYSFMALVAILATEVGLSLAGLFLGAHLAIGLSPWTPSISRKWLRRVLDPLAAILAWLSWIAVICLVAAIPISPKNTTLWSPEIWRGPVLFSLVFAPVGCLARFYLSLKLNGRIASFPLGTFVVNVGGTMILGMAYSIQHASISSAVGSNNIKLGGGSFRGCQVLQGIMDGFCGCLTTVSTWVLELSALRRRHAYFYGALSLVVAFCALVLEIGSLKWTRGFVTPACFAD